MRSCSAVDPPLHGAGRDLGGAAAGAGSTAGGGPRVQAGRRGLCAVGLHPRSWQRCPPHRPAPRHPTRTADFTSLPSATCGSVEMNGNERSQLFASSRASLTAPEQDRRSHPPFLCHLRQGSDERQRAPSTHGIIVGQELRRNCCNCCLYIHVLLLGNPRRENAQASLGAKPWCSALALQGSIHGLKTISNSNSEVKQIPVSFVQSASRHANDSSNSR